MAKNAPEAATLVSRTRRSSFSERSSRRIAISEISCISSATPEILRSRARMPSGDQSCTARGSSACSIVSIRASSARPSCPADRASWTKPPRNSSRRLRKMSKRSSASASASAEAPRAATMPRRELE
ncbi:MAG: hypothetical protein ACKOUS_18175 [Alphaproteobacteria bacterium]